MSRWPHTSSHEVNHPGATIITAATLHHKHYEVNVPDGFGGFREQARG